MAPLSKTKMSLVTAGTDCTVSQYLLRCGGKLFHSPGPAAASSVTKGAVGPGNDACPALCGA